MNKIAAFLLVAIFGVIVAIAFGALMALPVMWLWNGLLTGQDSILNVSLRPLGFLDAWGILVLTSILFKSSSTSASAK